MDKNQSMRYSEAERELLKITFGENDPLIFNIRNVLLQLQGNPVPELSVDVKAILQKMIVPSLSTDVPIGQQADAYSNLPDIDGMNPMISLLHIQAKDRQRAYLEQQFAIICGKDQEQTLILQDYTRGGQGEENRVVDMLAYRGILKHVEIAISNIRHLSNWKEETEEEKAKRLAQNSSK